MKTKVKKKKYDGGGFTAATDNLKIQTLAKKLPNELAPGPKLPGTFDPTGISEIGSSIAEMGSSIFSGLAKNAIDSADPRSNPAIAMKKANAMSTAGDLFSATAKGGVAGLITTGIGKILGAKKQRSDLAKAQTGWASDNLSSYSSAMTKSGYDKGGTIRGSGTGKSDSINMKAKNGAFIVPSENAEYGRQLGEEYLGWKPKEKAAKKEGSIDIKVSNSEVIFNPEEVRVLQYHGVNLDSLAPKANTAGAKSSGGSIHIKPENKGKFNATKKKTGKSTEALTHSSNPVTKKRAIFAQNARKWNHANGGSVDISNLKTGLSKKNNKLAPAPYNIEKAPVDPNATFNVTQNFKTPLTDINVVNKMVDLGYHTDPSALLKMTPEERQALIPQGSPLTYEKVASGTANQGEYKYYINDKKAAKNSNLKADGGPVTNPVKNKVSMTGALVNYMNNPKNTGASMTAGNSSNIPISKRRRNAESMDRFTNDPKNQSMLMSAGNMTGSISGLMNKMDVIESIVNSPKIARLGKPAQDFFRESVPGMDKEAFAKLAEDAGHTSLGKYWTNSPSAVSKLYKKGGSVKSSTAKKNDNIPTDYMTYLQGYGVGKDIRVTPIEAASMSTADLKKKFGIELDAKGLKYADEFHEYLMNNSDKWKNDPQYKNYGSVVPSTIGSYKKGGSVMKKKNSTISPGKAMEILHDGTAHGKQLTKKQKDFFGIHAFGKPKYETGGDISSPITREEAITRAETFKPNISTFKTQKTPGSTLKPLKPKSPANPPSDIGFAEIAGAVQAAGGAYGLATAKKSPDIGVSDTLRNLSADVRKQAAYGLDPDQLNVLNNSVERSRRDTNRFITESGGSGQEMMSKLNTTLGTTIAGKENIAFQDAAEKARKFSNVINVDSQIAGQEFDVKRMRREDWYKNQEMFASLLSTGIENIIGSRQFKEQQKTFRERDNRATFTIKQ